MRFMMAVVVMLVGAVVLGAAEPLPARDPFSPSPLMRALAQKPKGGEAAGAPAPAPVAAAAIPTLEGVVVIDQSVLACFRVGPSFILVECGESFQADGRSYVFARYEDGAVTLKDPEGSGRVVKIEPHSAPAAAAPACRETPPD
jgi:hypothetical protein